MQKEWKEKMIKVSSQSMPNLTNIFRIGREVVKSNISSDNKNIQVASVCATSKIVAAKTLSVNTLRDFLNISLSCFPSIIYLPLLMYFR